MSEQYATLSDYLERTKTRIEDFAARIGVGGPYVSMLARGLRTPSLPLALRIAAEAHIPVESLLPAQPGAAEPAPLETHADAPVDAAEPPKEAA